MDNGSEASKGSLGHGCPFHGNPGPQLEGTGDTDYERYLRVDELLSLQKPESEMAHPDELLFMTIHQSFELWCKMIVSELRRAGDAIEKDDLWTAARLIRRGRLAIRANNRALSVFDTMAPQDFHAVRRELGNGSGAESPGFKKIQREAPTLWPAIERLLQREGTTLFEIYTKAGFRSDLFAFFETMVDFDQEFYNWRQAHLAVVKRIIGRDVKSLKGYAVRGLEQDIHTPLWQPLWTVREQVTELEGTSPS